jgi:MFS family permease
LLAVSVALVMVQLDGTVVSVASPTIGAAMKAMLSGLQWVSNSYLLTISAMVVPAGMLGDRFGHRRLFLAGIAAARIF